MNFELRHIAIGLLMLIGLLTSLQLQDLQLQLQVLEY